MKHTDTGVISPVGFQAAGVRAGIKQKGKDIALIYSETPAKAAAAFTTNHVKAAPVVWSQRIAAKKGSIRAIVANSGNANACTGPTGLEHAIAMSETAAEALGLSADEVLVASTGVIGVPLPIDQVCQGIRDAKEHLGPYERCAHDAAQAIMTTDTFPKQSSVQLEIGGQTVTIAGMAKGSGMIHPNMATMLAFVVTDANISQEALDAALRNSVQDSYNMISVDGDTSTNDTLIVLANGCAGNAEIRLNTPLFLAFSEALHSVNTALAKQIAKDGEGATKLLEMRVQGARSKDQARKLVRAMLTSNLVKTAFFGGDPNWGRLMAAMGSAGVPFELSNVTISFVSKAGSVVLMDHSEPLAFDESLARAVLHEPEIEVNVSLHEGMAEAVGWGCDLSYEYVRINGEYRT